MRAQLADGRILEFPDGTDPAVIQATVKKVLGVQPEQQIQAQPQAQDVPRGTSREQINQALLSAPGGKELLEFSAAMGRGATELIDFFTTKPVGAALELAGVDAQVPTLTGALAPATTGGFVEPGLKRDILRTSGELVGPGVGLGAAFRSAATAIPAVQTVGQQTFGQGLTRALGASTPAQDVTLSALAGAGIEVGEETGIPGGELIGAFVAPIGAVVAQKAVTNLIGAGRRGIEALIRPLSGVSDDGAATLLAEAMVREGLTVNDVTRIMKELGPEAIPADIGTNLARLLRTASNKIPRIEGTASEVFKARQSGQGNRLLNALDDATGTATLTVDDEIARLNAVLKPQINRLYKEAGAQGLPLSDRLRGLLEGKSSVGKAQVKAQQRLVDKRAAGDEITNIDIIDSTKQVMDDQIGKAIRRGEANKARDLIRLNNIMV